MSSSSGVCVLQFKCLYLAVQVCGLAVQVSVSSSSGVCV